LSGRMPSRYIVPTHWADEELETARQDATADFIKERLGEGADRYQPVLAQCMDAVRELFRATSNLRDLHSGSVFATHPSLMTPARYLGGPPVSEDDLNILAGSSVAKRRRLDNRLAEVAASVIQEAFDRDRFPWLFDKPTRDPSPVELEVAVRWTSGLWAAQAVQTQRRGESAQRQELAVARALDDAGFERVQVGEIDFTARNMAPGQYCRETRVLGAKCDIPVMLPDSRLLLIECKVSNSSLNSIKRLIRETGGKSKLWRTGLGDRAITAAVLSGVFKLVHLRQAQDEYDVAILWERDLSPLTSFLKRVKEKS
jgi:hypothetical protein